MAFFGAGVAFQIAVADMQSVAAETTNYEVYRKKKLEMEGYQGGAIAGFTVGGAALISGVVLLVLGHDSEKEQRFALSFKRKSLMISCKF